MKRISSFSTWKKELVALLYGCAVFLCACWISDVNHWISSFLLFFSAVLLYFYFVYLVDDGNVLSLKALFSAFWLGTIGLADLKLLGYQSKWEAESWFVLALAYGVFVLAFMVMEEAGFDSFLNSRLVPGFQRFRVNEKLSLREGRLFWICCVATLIGAASFTANILVKGFIPFFVTDDYMAYYDFYTRFNIFTVASTACSGLCYYTIKTQRLGRFKKVVLYLCIFYEVFLMPTLAVSRGTQMIAILSLMVSVVSLNKHRFLTFLLCMAVAFGIYQVGSAARHLSNEYLDYVFQPKEIVISVGEEGSSDGNDEPEPSEPVSETVPQGEEPLESQTAVPEESPAAVVPVETAPAETPAPAQLENGQQPAGEEEESGGFVLPSQVAFLYGYLTVSHDNFNEAVVHQDGYSYGLRQLQAFTSILRFSALEEALEQLEFWQVNDALNTGNLITDAYYDFGGLGCGLFLFLWACIFSLIELFERRYQGPFSMLVLGNCMIPVVLCFFESWMSYFTFWLLWGTDFLLYLAAVIHFKKRKGD